MTSEQRRTMAECLNEELKNATDLWCHILNYLMFTRCRGRRAIVMCPSISIMLPIPIWISALLIGTGNSFSRACCRWKKSIKSLFLASHRFVILFSSQNGEKIFFCLFGYFGKARRRLEERRGHQKTLKWNKHTKRKIAVIIQLLIFQQQRLQIWHTKAA